MKKRRRVTNKRRKNGAIHVYLLMRVTLLLLPYMSVMILWILLKYPFLMKLMPSILVAMMCRDPGFAYVIPVTMQSYGEPRAVPTCLGRQGQAQNTLGKLKREGHPIQAG